MSELSSDSDPAGGRSPASGEPRIIAVASGKGGTGKSLLAANIGIFLATLGKRVILVDGALGGANLHVLTGMWRPTHTLTDALNEGVSMAEVVEPTPVPGLRLVAGTHDPAWVANLKPSQSRQLLAGIRTLPAELVVVDLEAGSNTHSLDWFLAADVGVLITLAEPTSVALCYRFIRAAFLRALRRSDLGRAVRRLASGLDRPDGGIPAPLDLFRAAQSSDPALAERIAEHILELRPHIVVNGTRSKADMELGRAVAAASRRRLGPPVTYLGHLEYDEAVWAAVRRSRPLLVEHPEARVSKCIEKVARRLLALRDALVDLPEVGAEPSFYDLFDVDPSASFEEIRRANRRTRELYGRDSIVTSGLYTDDQLDHLQAEFDEAYATLMDAAQRKHYDQALFPDGIPIPESALPAEIRSGPVKLEVPQAERPPMPAIDDDTEFTGPLLRQVREAQGIDLREIAERTKVGMTYLEALEAETFAKLPAPVYVRGFLVGYARMLGLDTGRVLDSYLSRYRDARRRLEASADPSS
ncbi:helix-turn-helix domain-containing protein [Haliangium sp.]|uniref:helix-turn-helix domain-containing protein n=1 Tax=Haliangium sp. TaxID=2663208 RepID=UPI003D12A3C1